MLNNIEAALDSMKATLDADGYDLGITGDEASVRIEVIPRADACVDCLVPSDLFAAIVRSQLEERHLSPEIEVVYPPESAAPH